TPYLLTTWASRRTPRCRKPVHKCVPLDSHDVSNPLIIKPLNPRLSDKLTASPPCGRTCGASISTSLRFPIHGQRLDFGGGEDAQEALHQLDSVCRPEVAALRGAGQRHPDDGH